MKDSSSRWLGSRAAMVAALAVLASVVAIVPVSASHSEVSLSGSNFEIDEDANTKQDDPDPSIDWLTANTDSAVIVVEDLDSGQNDDSFGQGTKEDTEVPVVVDGSIPPNKSDLLEFGVYQEEAGTAGFLHLFWSRVQDPSGTTNMDFEFNKNKCVIVEGSPTADSMCSGNGVTPVRSVGDLLIVYELSKGGTHPELFLFTWLDGSEGLSCEASNSFPCWGDRTDLDASGDAAGSINTSTVPQGTTVDGDVLGPYDPRTFGEATIDLDAIFDSGSCESFGSAYLKSRSSDSFPAALKDFIAPEPVNITNCGTVIIRKQTDPEENPNTTSFGFTRTFLTDDEQDPPVLAFSLMDDGVQTFNNVLFDTGLMVSEGTPPSGWSLVAIDCSASSGVTPGIDLEARTITFDIDDAADIVDCTFTNQAKGTIIVEKITDDGSGAFNFTSTTLSPAAFTLTTTAAGDGGKGSRTFADLSPGTYDVGETVPTGWNLVSSSCSDGSSIGSIGLGAGETVTCTFHDARKRGAIEVTKTRKHAADGSGDHPHEGVSFEIYDGDPTVDGVLVDTVQTNALGKACSEGLLVSSFVGDYYVVEIVPSGYAADGDTTKTVTVAESTCASSPATLTFSNTPLTNVTVSVDSQVDGGTSSAIVCTDSDGNESSNSTGTDGDGSLTVSNLEPTDPTVTLTCEITIDP